MKKIVALLLSLLLVVMSVSALAATPSKTINAVYQNVIKLTGAKKIANSQEVENIGKELEKALKGEENNLPAEAKELIAGLEGKSVLDVQTFSTADGATADMNTPANIDGTVTALIGGLKDGQVAGWKKIEITKNADIMSADVKKWLDDNGFTDFVVYIIG